MTKPTKKTSAGDSTLKPAASSSNATIDRLLQLGLEKRSLQAREVELSSALEGQQRQVAVMFVDLVGSTAYKLAHSPTEWLMRLNTFMSLVTRFIQERGGTISKYIGDEVMAYFDDDKRVNSARTAAVDLVDALKRLGEANPDFPTCKIALDYGDVFFLEYAGHAAPDPQGTTVDRCARIASVTPAGTILASKAFREAVTSKTEWQHVADPDLKGLGPQRVYQLKGIGAAFEWKDPVTIPRAELEKLKGRIEELEESVASKEDAIDELKEQLREAGKEPVTSLDDADEREIEDDPRLKKARAVLKKAIRSREGQRIILALDMVGQGTYAYIADLVGTNQADFTAVEKEDLLKTSDDSIYWLNDDDPSISEFSGLMGELRSDYESEPWKKQSWVFGLFGL